MSWKNQALEQLLEVKCHGNSTRWTAFWSLNVMEKRVLERLLEVRCHGKCKLWSESWRSNVMGIVSAGMNSGAEM